MRTTLITLSLLALSLFASAQQQEKTPAFPGAEGFGRYVTGGRGGKVYHVKNLKDTGAYSLRWCLQQSGAKTIVFDVSGTIHLQSGLNIGSDVTIAGQTAPGDGICVADYPVSIKGNNVIVRYMRFRLGNKNVLVNGADGWDGFGGFDQQDWIIDHCSVSWSIDECLSVLGNRNTTVQWCLVAQSLVNSGHSKGAHGYGGNWGGSGASFHHNLIAHHTSRTPRLGPRPTTQLDERMDMRNNVIYNFGGNGCYGGEGMTVNIVNNYYKPGPGSPTDKKGYRIAGIGIRTNEYVTTYPAYAPALHLWGKYYVTGNYNTKYSTVNNDNWTYGIINQVDANGCDGTWTQATRDSIKLTEPMPFVCTTTHTAADAYQRVLSYVGASLHRDSFDEQMVNDTRNNLATATGKGLSKGFINSQDDNKPYNADSDWSAWPALESTEAPADTDGDGMPDEWETTHGLNPNDAADGKEQTDEGYTNLEVYLNSLVADITEAQYDGGEEQGYKLYEEVNNDGSEPGKVTKATGSVTWPFHGEVTSVSIAAEVAPYVSSADVSWGSNVSFNKKRTIGGVDFAEVAPKQNNEATANADNAISYNITMADGYFFRPTNVSFLASRIGTDGGAIDVIWKNDNGEYTIRTGISPDRNNSSPGYSTISEDITAVGSAAGTSSLRLHIYKLGNTKQIALANIAVSGEVKTTDTEGISQVAYGPVLTQYYSPDGTLLASPCKGINIVTTTLPDGTRQSRKVMY